MMRRSAGKRKKQKQSHLTNHRYTYLSIAQIIINSLRPLQTSAMNCERKFLHTNADTHILYDSHCAT